jgi:hypothetical protein
MANYCRAVIKSLRGTSVIHTEYKNGDKMCDRKGDKKGKLGTKEK